MKKGKVALLLFLFAFAFFALGYFRNYIFLALNYRTSVVYYNSISPPFTGILSVFNSYNYNTLITAKWILTFLFILLFTLLSALTIFFLYHKKSYIYLTFLLHALFLLISLLFVLPGKIFPSFTQHGFNISRSFAHLSQSPVITLVLVMAIYYYRRTNHT